ncbi:MAG: hypothetical protein GX625_08530 [Clostridiaceae bacterium]|nr:hypothetical protein [Clostridiaceae bacterium]
MQLYVKALSDIISYDSDLMPGSRKIGIDFSRMNVSYNEKERILDYLDELYPLDVIETTTQRNYDDKIFYAEIFIDGFKDGCVIIWCTSFGGELGGAGFKGYYKYESGNWTLVKQEQGWVS